MRLVVAKTVLGTTVETGAVTVTVTVVTFPRTPVATLRRGTRMAEEANRIML